MSEARLGFACMYRHSHRSLAVKELEAIEKAFNPQIGRASCRERV